MEIQDFKNELKQIADEAKASHPNDKPLIRQIINDYLDYLCREHNLPIRHDNILSNYACDLHPKTNDEHRSVINRIDKYYNQNH